MIPNSPKVRVPVLSKITWVIFLAFSKVPRFRMSKPFLAPMLVETAVTKGIARPRAWGQEMMITVTARVMAKSKSFPMDNHTVKVRIPAKRAI